MVEQIHMRGEGGQVITMDLPVPSHYAKRIERGELVEVNADGSPVDVGTEAARPARKRASK